MAEVILGTTSSPEEKGRLAYFSLSSVGAITPFLKASQ